MSEDHKKHFVVTLENGEKVDVAYNPGFLNHLEYRGNISSTGYRSDFPFPYGHEPTLDEVKETAQIRTQQLYNENPAKHGITKSLF